MHVSAINIDVANNIPNDSRHYSKKFDVASFHRISKMRPSKSS